MQHSKTSASDERRGGASGRASDGLADDSYLSEGSSVLSRPACYDASASDTDSGDSELELSSNASAVWSPTIRRPRSDSGSNTEDRLSRIDKYLRESGKVSPDRAQLDTSSQGYTHSMITDRQDNYEEPPPEGTQPEAVVDRLFTDQQGLHARDRLDHVRTCKIIECRLI